ncbi:TerB family tellurite resistance protein [Halocola ammonii]
MAKYVKWIGGAVGWAMGGPIGAALGFALGYMFEDNSLAVKGQQDSRQSRNYSRNYQQYRHRTQPGDFASALLVLSATIMKADGKVMKSELNYVRDFFEKQFGPAMAAEQVGLLREILKKPIQERAICEQIRYNMEHPMRLQLLHYLFGIAQADGKVDSSEASAIERIAGYLGISAKDFQSIQAMFYKDVGNAYKVLEIDSSASDNEVKKAYRKMAMKYHPDKLKNLGEEHANAARDKFQKVTDAYETIKKERGIK